MSAAQKVDWSKVEPIYRAGIRSLREIGEEFGVSAPAIVKRAKTCGWARDLRAKVNAAADAKVNAAMVNAEVNGAPLLTEQLRVEVESEVQARIRLEHRRDLAKLREHAMTLRRELDLFEGELPLKSRVLKDVAEVTAKLMGLEREAFGINAAPPPATEAEAIDPTEVARRMAFVFAAARTIQ